MNAMPCRLTALAVCILSSCLAEPFVEEECPRIRRPVDELTEDELMLYVEGMQAIRANGKYQVIIDAHNGLHEIHRASFFLFYHAYYVWEVESQIRDLGGKFKCFGLPYYDWTIDAGFEHNPWILNSVFGGVGDPENMHCVESSYWSVEKWPIRESCDEAEDPEIGCCLKRELWPQSKVAAADVMAGILKHDDFKVIEPALLYEHFKVHLLFGGDLDSPLALYFIDDPLFMVLHCFVAYLRAVWAACHGYDVLTGDELSEDLMENGAFCGSEWQQCGTIELDDVYEFGVMKDYQWSITSQMDVTPRKMWDFRDWNVRYDPGSFLRRSGMVRDEGDAVDVDENLCSAPFWGESPWMEWGAVGHQKQETPDSVIAGNAGELQLMNRDRSRTVTVQNNSWTLGRHQIIAAVLMMVTAFALNIYWLLSEVRSRKNSNRYELLDSEAVHYGTI